METVLPPDSNEQIIYAARLVEDAKLPLRKLSHDAGMDIFALLSAEVAPFSFGIVKTGITFSIPKGYCMLAKPKSRHDFLIGAGVIDDNYQGEILIKIYNPTQQVLRFEQGDAIAQLLLVAVATPAIKEKPLSEIHPVQSDRGGTGGIVSQLEKIDRGKV